MANFEHPLLTACKNNTQRHKPKTLATQFVDKYKLSKNLVLTSFDQINNKAFIDKIINLFWIIF
jgi:hypothetical protein